MTVSLSLVEVLNQSIMSFTPGGENKKKATAIMAITCKFTVAASSAFLLRALTYYWPEAE